MVITLTAIGRETDEGIKVVSEDQRIPYLDQWVRDYVDKRSVSEGMYVLVAEVDMDSVTVKNLTINSSCVSDQAERESEANNGLFIEDL